jgi:hypothetical protein
MNHSAKLFRLSAGRLCFGVLVIGFCALPVRDASAGDAVKSGWSFTGFPLVFSTPETGAGAGAGVVASLRKEGRSRPDSVNGVAFYTSENQYSLILVPSVYFAREEWKLQTVGMHSYFPSEFYGIGNDTDADSAEDYTTRTTMLKPALLRRVVPGLRVGIFTDWQETDVLELEEDGKLASGAFRGTEDYSLGGAGLAVEYDTRDNVFYPGKGSFHTLTAGIYEEATGSDFEYEAYEADLRHYTTLSERGILALRASLVTVHGDVPFEEYARLEYMRGIESNRYMDLNSVSFQAEYRFSISGRWKGVVFASSGDVFRNAGDWQPLSPKTAGGAGIRYRLSRKEKIHFRVDLGLAEEGGKMYFRMLEAF